MKANLEALLSAYLLHCRAMGQSPRTIEGKRSQLAKFLRWSKDHHLYRAEDISRASLEAYREFIARYRIPGSQRRLHTASQRNCLTAVKIFCRFLNQQNHLDTDPASHFVLPRAPRRLPRKILSLAELNRLLALSDLQSAEGCRDRAILETFFSTGLRRMELARLDLADLQTDARLLIVRRGKGGKDRVVPIARRALSHIKHYRRQSRPLLVAGPSESAMFINNQGVRFSGGQLSYLVKRYLNACGIKSYGACHVFRHSAATHMHEGGADIRVVQEFLGHSDISSTQIYTQLSQKHLRRVYEATHPAAKGTRNSKLSRRADPI